MLTDSSRTCQGCSGAPASESTYPLSARLLTLMMALPILEGCQHWWRERLATQPRTPQYISSEFSMSPTDMYGISGPINVQVIDQTSSPVSGHATLLGNELKQALLQSSIVLTELSVVDLAPIRQCSTDQVCALKDFQQKILYRSNSIPAPDPAENLCTIQLLEYRPYVPQRLAVTMTVTNRTTGTVLATTTATWNGEDIPVTNRGEPGGWLRRRRAMHLNTGEEVIRVSSVGFVNSVARDIATWLTQVPCQQGMVVEESYPVNAIPSEPPVSGTDSQPFIAPAPELILLSPSVPAGPGPSP